MKYLYNPSNRMAMPFSQKIYERRRDLVVLDKPQLDRVLRGEDIQSVLHGGAPAATKKSAQRDGTVNLQLHVGDTVTSGLNRPAEKVGGEQPAPKAAQEPKPEQKKPAPAPEGHGEQESKPAQEPAPKGEGDTDQFANGEGAPAPKKEGEGEPAPAAPRDFAGIDRTNVTRELFESVTDEELPIFAKNVLGLDVEMNPSTEDKASIDLAAWRADVRVQVGKQVTKALRKQALTGSR